MQRPRGLVFFATGIKCENDELLANSGNVSSWRSAHLAYVEKSKPHVSEDAVPIYPEPPRP